MKRILCAARRPQPHSLTSSLVSGCPASGCNNSLNALWHRSIQGLNFVRGDRSKCFFQSRPKVLFACEHAITQLVPNNGPKVLNWVQVRAHWRPNTPIETAYMFGVQPHSGTTSTVRRSAILLKHVARPAAMVTSGNRCHAQMVTHRRPRLMNGSAEFKILRYSNALTLTGHRLRLIAPLASIAAHTITPSGCETVGTPYRAT